MKTRKIQISPKGQYTVTIPRALALARGLEKHHEGEWKLTKEGKLRLEL